MGRPRKHLDDAARSAAYRERASHQAALADMALTILRQPTLKLVAHIAQTLAEKADDKAEMAARVAEAMLEGLQRGGGANCADAARNVLRYPSSLALPSRQTER